MEYDLSKMIVPSKTVWADYPGLEGFEVQLAYLTKDELMKIRDKSLVRKINRSRAVEDELDNELFQTLYFKAVIKDWRGLKLKYLRKLLPVDTGEAIDDELEYSVENAEVLMKNSSQFESWVGQMLEDVENFTAAA